MGYFALVYVQSVLPAHQGREGPHAMDLQLILENVSTLDEKSPNDANAGQEHATSSVG